jgi:hypothetical protein
LVGYLKRDDMSSEFWATIAPIILWAVLFGFAVPMSRRKGCNLGYALLGTIPFWGALYLLWLASLPDKDLIDRIARLEAEQDRP